MNSFEVREWVKRQMHRVGVDVIRHPSPRLFSGHLELVLHEQQIDCVLDVGANSGQFGGLLRELGYEGSIVSFEPVSATFAALQAAAAADPTWVAVNVALGAEPGRMPINVTRGTDLASLLKPAAATAGGLDDQIAVAYTEEVAVQRLDDTLAEIVPDWRSRRLMLKLDTQGFDLEVVRGADATLQAVAALISEVSVVPLYEGMPRWIESLSEFDRLGFVPTGLFPVTYATDVAAVEFDCVMVRPGG